MYITIKEILNKDRNYNDKINSNEEGLDFLENESYYNRKFPRNNIDSSQDCLKQKDSNTVNIEKKFNFIIGDSGAGKTITALAIGELLDIRKWKIDIEGCKNKKIAYIFQEPKSFLDSCFTISDQFVEIGISEDKIKERLKEVNLSEGIERRYPHQISGGERQRVMIALAIASGDIDLLIADEPTSSLDFENQKIILDILKKLSADKRIKHILFITHDRLLVSNFIKDNDNDCKCFKFKKNKEINEINIEDLIEETRLIINPKNIKDSSSNVQDKNHYNDSNLILQNQNICITHKKTNRRILTNLSIEICKKQVIGIVGTSGCGKTTLINYLIGIINPKEWDISSDKKRNNQLKQQAIFQDSDQAFNPNTNIKEIFYETYQLFINEDDDNFDNWIYNQLHFCNILKKGMDLNEVIYKYPSQFSGGEKQRLALIRVLAAKPDIIFADEPFSRLDMKNKFEMINLMKRAQENSNLSYLIASHDLQTASIFCDKIIILEKGQEGAKQVNLAIKKVEKDQNKWQLVNDNPNDIYSNNILLKLNQILKIDLDGSKIQNNKNKEDFLEKKRKVPKINKSLRRYYNILTLGHSSDVNCIECSNDGNFLATAEEYGIIIVWSTKTYKILSILGGEGGHTGKINAIKFTTDQHLLISAGEGGVCIWDTVDWKKKFSFLENKKVNSIDYFENDNEIAICYDSNLEIWNINNQKRISDISIGNPINNINISKDKKYIICGLERGFAQCEVPLNKKKIKRRQTRFYNFNLVKFSPIDSNILATANRQSPFTIKLFQNLEELEHKVIESGINSIAFISNGNKIVVGSDKCLTVFDLKLKKLKQVNKYKQIKSVNFLPNNDNSIFFCSSNKVLFMSDYDKPELICLNKTPNESIKKLVIIPRESDSEIMIIYDKIIKIWNNNKNDKWVFIKEQDFKSARINNNFLLYPINISEKKRIFFLPKVTKNFCIKNLLENESNEDSKFYYEKEVRSCVSIGKNEYAIATSDEILLVINKKFKDRVRENKIIQLSYNKRHIIGFCSDEIKIWSYNENKELKYKGVTHVGNYSTFALYDQYIITDSNHIINIYETDISGQKYDLVKIRTLKGHTGTINKLCFSPCGKYVISGSNDQTVRVWSFDEGKCINTISLIGFINTISFLPESNDEILAAGSRGCIYRCNIKKPEPISITYLLYRDEGKFFLTVDSNGDLIKADDNVKSSYYKKG